MREAPIKVRIRSQEAPSTSWPTIAVPSSTATPDPPQTSTRIRRWRRHPMKSAKRLVGSTAKISARWKCSSANGRDVNDGRRTIAAGNARQCRMHSADSPIAARSSSSVVVWVVTRRPRPHRSCRDSRARADCCRAGNQPPLQPWQWSGWLRGRWQPPSPDYMPCRSGTGAFRARDRR